mgnify:CR=1 FL=1
MLIQHDYSKVYFYPFYQKAKEELNEDAINDKSEIEKKLCKEYYKDYFEPIEKENLVILFSKNNEKFKKATQNIKGNIEDKIDYNFLKEKDELIHEDDNDFDEDSLHMSQLLKTTLVDLGLSVRSLNCLKHAEVFTLGELVSFSKNDLLKFRNFGKKSLTELEELVEEKNLHFGFDVSKYNLN